MALAEYNLPLLIARTAAVQVCKYIYIICLYV